MNVSVNLDALTPITEAAAKLMSKLAGRPCEVTGELLADQLQYWRWKNRVRILEKVDERLKYKKVDARELPLSFYFPLLEEAGNVDTDELQTLWANMLAESVVSPRVCKRSFVETLKRFSLSEVRVLNAVATGPLKFALSFASSPDIELPEPVKGISLDDFVVNDAGEIVSSLSLLATNGCILVRSRSTISRIKSNVNDFRSSDLRSIKTDEYIVWLTSYGADLVAACTDILISAKAVKQPWSLTDDAIEMAADARHSGLGEDKVQQMIEASTPRIG